MSEHHGEAGNTPRCEVRAPDCKGKYKKRPHEHDLEINRGGHIVRACSNPLCQIEALDAVRNKIQEEEQMSVATRANAARSVS